MPERLCYVEGSWAYFTTQELKNQWGDDWNDTPYEHNAGDPYIPCWHNEPDKLFVNGRGYVSPGELCQCELCKADWNMDGTPKWEIKVVIWDGAFGTPDQPDYYPLSCSPIGEYSVKKINHGVVPWLRSFEDDVIYAGISIKEFCKQIKLGGGTTKQSCASCIRSAEFCGCIGCISLSGCTRMLTTRITSCTKCTKLNAGRGIQGDNYI